MTLSDDHQFPDELAWRDDGHVSDEVVTALADGQRAVVPMDAYVHVHNCAACGNRLGQAALVASVVDQALVPEACPAAAPVAKAEQLAVADTMAVGAAAQPGADPALVPATESELTKPSSGRRLPLPVPALAVAIAMAALGALPTLLEVMPRLPTLLASAAGQIQVLVHTVAVAFRAVVENDGTAVTLAWTGAGLVLLMVGVLITRLMPLGIEVKGDDNG